MASLPHKGFKFVKGKSVVDSEVVSYDDLEDPKGSSNKRKSMNNSDNEERQNLKKHRNSSSSNVSANSKSSNQSSKQRKTTSGKAVSTTTQQKHHYPKTEFKASSQLLKQSSNVNANHAAVLSNGLKEIVQSEMDALSAFSKSEEARTIRGGKYVFDSLNDVMSAVVQEVQRDCPVDAHFEPELSKSERMQLKQLREAQKVLEQHSAKLQQYEDNLDLLSTDFDLWLGQEKIQDILNGVTAAQNTTASTDQRADQVMMRNYLHLLKSLEQHCAHIITSCEGCEDTIAQTRRTQGILYDKLNKVRLEQVTGNSKAAVPKDAKDLLRSMPNKF